MSETALSAMFVHSFSSQNRCHQCSAQPTVLNAKEHSKDASKGTTVYSTSNAYRQGARVLDAARLRPAVSNCTLRPPHPDCRSAAALPGFVRHPLF